MSNKIKEQDVLPEWDTGDIIYSYLEHYGHDYEKHKYLYSNSNHRHMDAIPYLWLSIILFQQHAISGIHLHTITQELPLDGPEF